MAYRKNKPMRRGTHSRAKQSNIASAPLWLLMGLFAGILGAFIIYLLLTGNGSFIPLKFSTPTSTHAKIHAKNTTKKLEKPTQSQKSKNVVQKKESTQRFEFYQLLPGMEVPIPDTQHSTKAEVKTQKILTPPKPASQSSIASAPIKITPKLAKTQTKLAATQYLIQAGAYRTLSSAEALKSRLTTYGLISRIQKIEAEDGFWFRVTLGPYPSETMALHQKNRLAKQKIQGILILQRQKGG